MIELTEDNSRTDTGSGLIVQKLLEDVFQLSATINNLLKRVADLEAKQGKNNERHNRHPGRTD
jgi:hypothetical protein